MLLFEIFHKVYVVFFSGGEEFGFHCCYFLNTFMFVLLLWVMLFEINFVFKSCYFFGKFFFVEWKVEGSAFMSF